jgi:hypothetical protein
MNTLIPPSGDMEDVITPWGILPRWKARALAIAEIQTVLNEAEVLNDSAAAKEESATAKPALDDQRAPALAADEVEENKSTLRVDDKFIASIHEACDRLSARLDVIEAERRAERELLNLEDAVEREQQQSSEDCDTTTIH